MKTINFKRYLLNCFILILPILIWNIFFTKFLPKGFAMDFFWKNIPAFIGTSENILRTIVIILPIIMQLSLKSRSQKIGFIIYAFGVIVYFLSWIFQIYFPDSIWCKSIFGFMAPAYTTIFWLTGIGVIGKNSFVKIPFLSIIYVIISICFVIVHSYHTYLVYQRL